MMNGGDSPAAGESKSVVVGSSSSTTRARTAGDYYGNYVAAADANGSVRERRHDETMRGRKGGNSRAGARNNNGEAGTVLSGGSPADNDAAYCNEVARRSAARAALHLGVEGMEGTALDVLGSVLLGYMDTVRRGTKLMLVPLIYFLIRRHTSLMSRLLLLPLLL